MEVFIPVIYESGMNAIILGFHFMLGPSKFLYQKSKRAWSRDRIKVTAAKANCSAQSFH